MVNTSLYISYLLLGKDLILFSHMSYYVSRKILFLKKKTFSEKYSICKFSNQNADLFNKPYEYMESLGVEYSYTFDTFFFVVLSANHFLEKEEKTTEE